MLFLFSIPFSILFLFLAFLCYRRGFYRQAFVLSLLTTVLLGAAATAAAVSWYLMRRL